MPVEAPEKPCRFDVKALTTWSAPREKIAFNVRTVKVDGYEKVEKGTAGKVSNTGLLSVLYDGSANSLRNRWERMRAFVNIVRAQRSHSDLESIDLVREMLAVMEAEGFASEPACWNLLMESVAGTQRREEASEVVFEMTQRGVVPNTRTYQLLMQCGLPWRSTLDEFFLPHAPPSRALYSIALSSTVVQYSLREALQILWCMDRDGLTPSERIYAKIVNISLRVGAASVAREVLRVLTAELGSVSVTTFEELDSRYHVPVLRHLQDLGYGAVRTAKWHSLRIILLRGDHIFSNDAQLDKLGDAALEVLLLSSVERRLWKSFFRRVHVLLQRARKSTRPLQTFQKVIIACERTGALNEVKIMMRQAKNTLPSNTYELLRMKVKAMKSTRGNGDSSMSSLTALPSVHKRVPPSSTADEAKESRPRNVKARTGFEGDRSIAFIGEAKRFTFESFQTSDLDEESTFEQQELLEAAELDRQEHLSALQDDIFQRSVVDLSPALFSQLSEKAEGSPFESSGVTAERPLLPAVPPAQTSKMITQEMVEVAGLLSSGDCVVRGDGDVKGFEGAATRTPNTSEEPILVLGAEAVQSSVGPSECDPASQPTKEKPEDDKTLALCKHEGRQILTQEKLAPLLCSDAGNTKALLPESCNDVSVCHAHESTAEAGHKHSLVTTSAREEEAHAVVSSHVSIRDNALLLSDDDGGLNANVPYADGAVKSVPSPGRDNVLASTSRQGASHLPRGDFTRADPFYERDLPRICPEGTQPESGAKKGGVRWSPLPADGEEQARATLRDFVVNVAAYKNLEPKAVQELVRSQANLTALLDFIDRPVHARILMTAWLRQSERQHDADNDKIENLSENRQERVVERALPPARGTEITLDPMSTAMDSICRHILRSDVMSSLNSGRD